MYVEDFLGGVTSRSGGAAALLMFYRLKWLVKRVRHLCLEDVQIAVVAASGKKGGALQRPLWSHACSGNFFRVEGPDGEQGCRSGSGRGGCNGRIYPYSLHPCEPLNPQH